MGTSVSSAFMARIRTFAVVCATFALALGLAPATSLAADAPMLASSLLDGSTAIVSEDVELVAVDDDGVDAVIEPVIGSFTVDGLTFAVGEDGVSLVSVEPSVILSAASAAGGVEGSLSIPPSITYAGVTYDVTTIGPYAFYLSGATQVVLPASITSVDDRAFRSSDVERVEVAADNPSIVSFDGCLYDSQLLSLLLIPEGRAGAVLLPKQAEVASPSKFSHCSLVDAISVEEGGAAFASWEGLLYSSDGTTLLRVPAGATEITIREGCTTIAAGAMEGCAKLERINAPATVTSISPNVFESVPTVSLPAMTLQDESVAMFPTGAESASADNPAEVGKSLSRLTATVALEGGEAIQDVDAATVDLVLAEEKDAAIWTTIGFQNIATMDSDTDLQAALSYGAGTTSTLTNLTNSYAYPKWRNLASSWALSTISTSWPAAAWTFAPGASIGLSSLSYDGSAGFGVSALCGSVLDHAVIYPGNGAWISWFTSNALTTGSTSTIFYIYYEQDARTVVSKAVASAPDRTYLYRSGSSTVNRTITWDANGGTCDIPSTTVAAMTKAKSPVPTKLGYKCLGWYVADGFPFAGQKVCDAGETTGLIVENRTLEAHWERIGYDISFDTDSEPGDEEYPSEAMPDQDAYVDDGMIEIEDPKRPGYVFQGWVIPNGDGTEAIDQDLVYQGDDGKWYVDASKLPDYATDGKVELTARWTSIISVDVPSAVTFYADVVTQGNESREGAASSAFGQSKVANQSQVDLRVVGLESSAVETTDTTLGADSILKKATAATPATSAQKLLSLYPSTKAWTAEELQDPEAVGGAKAAAAVDFDLDDILLEKSFAADDFTIPAGDTLNMGYRLNLTETGQELDYGKLETLDDGQSASIANVSYCFSADPLPSDWGEPLWIENPDQSENPARYLLLDDIKEAADDLSANGKASAYYGLYKSLLDAQVANNGNPGVGPYFKVNINGIYWDLQLIGICQDTKTADGKKAGLTFQLRDAYAYGNFVKYPGKGSYPCYMNPSAVNSGGWASAAERSTMRSTFYGYLDVRLQSAIAPVTKYQQLPGGSTAAYLQKTTNETVWLPSAYEVFGTVLSTYNEAEGLTTVSGYAPFQYMAYQGNNGSTTNLKAMRKAYASATSSSPSQPWLRSACRYANSIFCALDNNSALSNLAANASAGIAPCFCL